MKKNFLPPAVFVQLPYCHAQCVVTDWPFFLIPLSTLHLKLDSMLPRLHLKKTTLGGRWALRSGDGVDRAVATETLEPSTAVELSVVLVDKTVAVDQHVVDAGDGIRQGVDLPSPGDGATVVPDVEDIDANLRLKDTLAIVECSLAVEGDGAQREASHEVDRVGDIDEVG